jgi:hypothetical protein
LASIRTQRRAIVRQLQKTPSLQHVLADPGWLQEVWDDALMQAYQDTHLSDFPEQAVWTIEQIRDPAFLPQ